MDGTRYPGAVPVVVLGLSYTLQVAGWTEEDIKAKARGPEDLGVVQEVS